MYPYSSGFGRGDLFSDEDRQLSRDERTSSRGGGEGLRTRGHRPRGGYYRGISVDRGERRPRYDRSGDVSGNRGDQERGFHPRFRHAWSLQIGDSMRGRESMSTGRGKMERSHMHGQRFKALPHGEGKSEHTTQFERRYVHRLSIRDLNNIARRSPDEVVDEVNANLKGFQQSLADCYSLKTEDSKDHYVNTVLVIISKVSNSSDEETASKILGEFLSERCSKFHQLLTEYVKKQSFSMLSTERISQLCDIFEMFLIRLPTSAWSVLPIEDLSEVSESLLLPGELVSKISDMKKRRNEIREHFKQQRANALKQSLARDFDDWDNSLYRTIPILPTLDEVCDSSPPLLRSNIIQGSYEGWEHYYDVQFRLLREDFVAPLRRGIQSFLQGVKTRELHDINIYRNVQVKEPVFTRQGMCFRLSFDNSRFQKNWEHSKRLLYGSLLCLSPDSFENEVYFGTVFERKPEDLDRGFFIAKFEDYECIFDHHSTQFLMAESRAYFEASRHILQSLQKAEIETMPFTECLLKYDQQGGLVKTINPPRYLTDSSASFDLRWLYSQDQLLYQGFFVTSEYEAMSNKKRTEVDILDQNQWPEVGDVVLDQSQLNAIKMALTQEVAVIQGPPGTGKTYIGYKIVQTLLENREVWDPHGESPILVMCFTNHALDQFLEGLLECNVTDGGYGKRKPRIVRIGGRSKNEKIKELNISRTKSWVPPHHLFERNKVYEGIDKYAKQINWKSLKKTFNYPVNEFIVGPKGMKCLEIVINETHYEQLELLVNRREDALPHALEFWLGLWQKPMAQKLNAVYEPSEAVQTIKNTSHLKDNEISTLTHGDSEDEMLDVEGEAELEMRERVLEDDRLRMVIERENEEEQFLEQGMDYQFYPYVTLIQGKERKPLQEVHRTLKQIQNEVPLTEDDEEEISDIRALGLQNRMRLFRLWIQKYQQYLTKLNKENIEKYNELCKKAAEIQQKIDRFSLENAEVIGMTTTGAAKYQHIIHLVKPKIVIVEEAAELLESHIVSALNAGTQHLILIGDHKQLRPKPNDFDLAKKHNLHISLFERLIKNGLPHATLMMQHRMRPQIASLVCPHIYDRLENHESVMTRENVKGFDNNLFFFHHEHEEDEEDLHLLSHSNAFEAEMVKALCLHILKQGFSPSQMTILTAYTGQLLRIRKLMPKKIFEGVRVVNVDNFQGEENDIIILSLVRNNPLNKVGFLREENRVCVALSRAKMGFYCFGNFKMLRNTVPIWEVILSDVESKGCLSESFSLHCHNHPTTKHSVREPGDFQQFAPEGGCIEKCVARLDCGHSCTHHCHLNDPDHLEFKCLKPCSRTCPEGHPCDLLCHKGCDLCSVRVTRILPKCSHEQDMHCFESPDTFLCRMPCPNKCSAGHQCLLFCGEGCEPCKVIVKRIMPKCSHEQTMECHIPVELHYCDVQVDKVVPHCGHTETMPCHCSPALHSCSQPCEKTLICGHLCKEQCGEMCTDQCEELVQIKLDCGHEKNVPCFEKNYSRVTFPSVQFNCSFPCEKTLSCGHQCKGKCGDPCSIYKCKEIVQVTLQCGHSIETQCRESHSSSQTKCTEPCNKTLKLCGHPCPNKCGETCPILCLTEVPITCPKGHSYLRQCFRSAQPCSERCLEALPCHHSCMNTCSEPCGPCKTAVKEKCGCGHTHPKVCGNRPKCSCPAKCTFRLKCGHICSGRCEECYTTRVHASCTQNVSFTSYCGHHVTTSCLGMEYKCPNPCQISLCPHNKKQCDHTCFKTCDKTCQSKCAVSCPHVNCTKQCDQPCDTKACNEPCTKPLRCGHYCPGLCGEKCLLACMTCNPKKFREKAIGLGKKTQPDAHRYIQLDCGHFFTVQYLDNAVHSSHKEDCLVTPPRCPSCLKPMSYVKRYWFVKKQTIEDIQQIKQRNVVNVKVEEYKYKGISITHIPRTPEAVCSMEMQPLLKKFEGTEGLVLELKTFMRLRKLSEQLFIDFSSELYRFHLSKVVSELQDAVDRNVHRMINSSEMKALGSTMTLLQQMEANHSLRISEHQYQTHLHDLKQLEIFSEALDIDLNFTKPMITKGEWYKCSRAGHLYLTPAGNRKHNKPTKCDQC